MKKVSIPTRIFSILIVTAVLLTSCKKDLEKELIQKRQELATLNAEIKALEEEISKTSKDEKVELTKVEVVTLDEAPFDAFLEVHGMLESDDDVTINPEGSGIVKEIRVKEGQRVTKGQILAVLDNEMTQSSSEELKKNLEFARQLFEKQQNLKNQGVGTDIQYLEAKNRVESLEKSLSTINTAISKSYVKSPISGVIDEVFPKKGEIAAPQMPMFRIVSQGNMFVKATLSESYLGTIKEGEKVDVSLPSLNEKVKGSIITTGNFINPNNRTFEVKVMLDSRKPTFLPNLLSVTTFRVSHLEHVVAIPSKAILNDGTTSYIYVVDEKNNAKRIPVKTGITHKGQTVILEGLKKGDKLIVKGQTSLVDGQKVGIVK